MVFKLNSNLSLLIIFFTVALTFFSCSNNEQKGTDSSQLPKVSLRQEWIAYSGFAGEIVASEETDSLNGIDLTIQQSADDVDPVKMVLSGNDMFGIAGADRIIIDNQKGADLVIIGVANYKTPVCFAAKEEDNLKSLKDFKRLKIGTMAGNHVDYVYDAMLNKMQINRQSLNEVEAPFDIATFITDAYDVRPIYSYVEGAILDQKKVKYTTICPEEYGVAYIGPVYFTKRETIEKYPQIVQEFINSIIQGWEITISNPSKAVKLLTEYDKSLNYDTELLSLERGLPFFKGENNKILWASDSSWINTVNNIKQINYKKLGLTTPIKNINYKEFVNYSFLNKYYSKKIKK